MEIPDNGTLPMAQVLGDKYYLPGSVVPIELIRCAAKINYNISAAPSAGDIRITSVEFCSIPRTTFLDYGSPGTYKDIAVFDTPGEVQQSIAGTCYMAENLRGEVPSITDQKFKNVTNAPRNASYILIRANRGNKNLLYYVYLGQNNTSDFNVKRNQEHTMNIRILNDSEVDTRITAYSITVTDEWNEEYNPCGETRLHIQATSQNMGGPGITLRGSLDVLENSGRDFELDQSANTHFELGAIAASGGSGDYIAYNYSGPPVSRNNNTLRYRVTIADNRGGELSAVLERKFANYIDAYSPDAAGTIDVSDAIRVWRQGSSSPGATCMEDGCTFMATAKDGYIFDGWYADSRHTNLLSTAAQYRHVPRWGLDAIYAKWKFSTNYNVTIGCAESNKNATYMFNKNTVSITSTDYTGTLKVEINKVSGGVFRSAYQYTVPVTAGQTATVGEMIFVPTQIGEVAYTIDVTTPEGIVIASRTVTNTAVATKLIPTIEIGYGDNVFGAYYNINGTSKSWSEYESVYVRVAFSPTLDYPAPLERKDLLEVKLKPQCQTFELIEKESIGNPGVMEPEYFYPGDQYPLSNVVAQYANNIDQSDHYIAISAKSIDEYRVHPTLFRPHTAGDEPLRRLLLPSTSILAIDAKMFYRTFVTYKMKPRPDPLEIQLVSKLSGIPLKIETNIPSINYTNKLF